MREPLREMIHYRNSLDPDEDLVPVKVGAFEERFGQMSLTMLARLRNSETNLYESASRIFA